MKKIIKGKKYDTDTATYLGGYRIGNDRDFSYVEESLYVKRTGEYFLLGEGGPSSKYAQKVDDNWWAGGGKIIPMTIEDAKSWAEKHLSVEKYERVFGAVDE